MVCAEERSERLAAGNIPYRRLEFSPGVTPQKAMLRSTLFSSRKLEVPVALLAISRVPARPLRSQTTGIGTELLADREKVEVTRPDSPFERSPVPMDGSYRR
jgi:hypothetical protein